MDESETSGRVGLRRLFAKSNFDTNKFVSNVSKGGEQDTSKMMKTLNTMSVDVSNKMKRAIFDNYKLFIKAGKAATQLETTMHQIHNEFLEKQRIMNALAEMSLFHESSTDPIGLDRSEIYKDKKADAPVSEYAGLTITALADLVEGASALSGDSTRVVLYDGDLRELSSDNFTPICTARMFLLTDCLIIAYHQSDSAFRYKLQANYDLNNFALVNIPARDRRYTPLNAFKLLVFPATRLFQAETPGEKQTWLRLIDEAMRKHRNSQSSTTDRKSSISINAENPSENRTVIIRTSRARDSKINTIKDQSPEINYINPPKVSPDAIQAGHKALVATLPECADLLNSHPSEPPSRKNPFDDSIDEDKQSETPKTPTSASNNQSPDSWLWDVPEDLDVACSERDFSRATNLVCKARKRLDEILANFSVMQSQTKSDGRMDKKSKQDWEKLSQRIERNQNALTEALEYELMTAASRHSTPKTVSSAVLQLGYLGKATLAAQLFLLYRSQLMTKALTHGVHQEGNQMIYLNRLSMAFHRNLAETAAEWQSGVIKPLLTVYSPLDDGISKKQMENLLTLRFCSWVFDETDKFSQQLRILLIDSRAVSFHSMAHAAQRIRAHANKLSDLLGIDITSALHRGLILTWHRGAEDQARILCEAVEHRAKQETWEPLSNTLKIDQDKGIAELMELGLLTERNMKRYASYITMSTYLLVRALRQFAQSGNLLQCPDMASTLTSCLVTVLRTELKNYELLLFDPNLQGKHEVVYCNLDYLTYEALPPIAKLLNCSEHPAILDFMSRAESMLSQTI